MNPLFCYLLVLCVFGSFPSIYCAVQLELNRAEILCIQQSQEETALGRWLECLKSSEPDYPVVDLPEPPEMSILESPIPRDANDIVTIVESPTSGDSDGCILQVLTEEPCIEQQSAAIENLNEGEIPSIKESENDSNNSIHLENTDSNLIHVEEPLHTLALSPPNMQAAESEAIPHAFEKRSAAFSACPQKFGLLLFITFLHMIFRGWWKRKCSDKRWYEVRNIGMQKGNMEATCNPMETRRSDDYLSETIVKNGHYLALGSPLGSVVAAVFAEVLLTSCNCGLSVSADKINMLFRTTFNDMLAPVIGDSECLKLLDDFMVSFRGIYTTICRVHNSSLEHLELSQEKSRDIRTMNTKLNHGGCINPVEKYSCDTGMQDTAHQKLIKDVQSNNAQKESNLLNGANFHLDFSENTVSSKTCLDAGTTIVYGSRSPSLDRKANVVSVLSEKLENLKLVGEGDFCCSSEIENWAKRSCSLAEDVIADEIEHVKSLSSNDDFVEDIIPDSTTIVYGSRSATLDRKTTLVSALSENIENLKLVGEGDSCCSSKIEDRAKRSCSLAKDVIADGIEQVKSHSSNDDFAEDIIPDSRDCVNKVAYDFESATSPLSGNVLSKMSGPLGIVALAGECYRRESPDYHSSFLSVLERYVIAQEHHNQIKSVEVANLIRQHVLEEEKVQLTSISNDLMRENIQLNKSRASFKETRILEEKATSAYSSFNNTCADELAAGLVIMLVSLAFSVRKYSFTLLNDLVSLCQPPVVKESRRLIGFGVDWLLNSVDSLTTKLQAFVCHVTITGRIFIGSFIVAVIAASLLRRSVTNSSQRMPATILIIILGGVCGFVGKVSVDSVGGNGIRWLVIWEMFCLLHALVTCFTPFFYSVLHGSLSNAKQRRIIPFWFRNLAFHFVMLVLLPVLAGQLPFCSFRQVANESISSLIQAFYSLREFTL